MVIEHGQKNLPELECEPEIKTKKNRVVKVEKEDFRLSAKNLYLTYSNCSLGLEEIVIQLKEILSSYIVQDYILVREYHQTGEPHVHVYLKVLKKVNIFSSTFLDLLKEDGGIYHGNYQSARKPNSVIEYMLKTIGSKTDPNLYYSKGMSNLIGDLGNYKSLSVSLIDLAEEGKILDAMSLLKQENPDMYLNQGNKIEKRLIDIYKDTYMKTQRKYDLDKFTLSIEMFESLKEYIRRKERGENPVLALVGRAGTGKTNFLVSFFEQAFDSQVLVIKTADGLRHASFFKGKNYAIIFDDLDWKDENMTRERVLHLLSGEVTTTSNIKHSSVLVPKNTCRALSSNYSLHTIYPFQKEVLQTGSNLTCFSRRLHEIDIGSSTLYKKDKNLISGSTLLLNENKIK
jgi:Geminivirus Rep catalytic domain